MDAAIGSKALICDMLPFLLFCFIASSAWVQINNNPFTHPSIHPASQPASQPSKHLSMGYHGSMHAFIRIPRVRERHDMCSHHASASPFTACTLQGHYDTVPCTFARHDCNFPGAYMHACICKRVWPNKHLRQDSACTHTCVCNGRLTMQWNSRFTCDGVLSISWIDWLIDCLIDRFLDCSDDGLNGYLALFDDLIE